MIPTVCINSRTFIGGIEEKTSVVLRRIEREGVGRYIIINAGVI